MKAQLKALYALQQVDIQLALANKAMAALDNGAAVRQALDAEEKRLAAASEELRKSEAELLDSELKLKTVEAKKQNFESKLYAGEVTSAKELSSIEKEIEMLGKSRAKLDDRILELYEVVEQQKAAVAKEDGLATGLRERLARHTAAYKAKSAELAGQIEQFSRQRKSAIAGVTDGSLLQRYESIRARNKDTGLAKVEDGKCGGCHVGLTPYAVRMLREGDEVHMCESCGRILYAEEQG